MRDVGIAAVMAFVAAGGVVVGMAFMRVPAFVLALCVIIIVVVVDRALFKLTKFPDSLLL